MRIARRLLERISLDWMVVLGRLDFILTFGWTFIDKWSERPSEGRWIGVSWGFVVVLKVGEDKVERSLYSLLVLFLTFSFFVATYSYTFGRFTANGYAIETV